MEIILVWHHNHVRSLSENPWHQYQYASPSPGKWATSFQLSAQIYCQPPLAGLDGALRWKQGYPVWLNPVEFTFEVWTWYCCNDTHLSLPCNTCLYDPSYPYKWEYTFQLKPNLRLNLAGLERCAEVKVGLPIVVQTCEWIVIGLQVYVNTLISISTL